MGIGVTAALVAVFSVFVMTEFDILTGREETEALVGASRKTGIMWCVWAVAVAWIMLYSVGGASTFIYFQF